eukprot:499495-Pyramimonas_sp.AAC.1
MGTPPSGPLATSAWVISRAVHTTHAWKRACRPRRADHPRRSRRGLAGKALARRGSTSTRRGSRAGC